MKLTRRGLFGILPFAAAAPLVPKAEPPPLDPLIVEPIEVTNGPIRFRVEDEKL